MLIRHLLRSAKMPNDPATSRRPNPAFDMRPVFGNFEVWGHLTKWRALHRIEALESVTISDAIMDYAMDGRWTAHSRTRTCFEEKPRFQRRGDVMYRYPTEKLLVFAFEKQTDYAMMKLFM